MLSLVYPVADIIENNYSDIFEKAYHSVEAGNIYLDTLDAAELQVVFDLTAIEYEKFVQVNSTEEKKRRQGARWENWQTYMKLLGEDLRLYDREFD